MTNTQLLILAIVLVAIYFYQSQSFRPKPSHPETEVFYDAEDFELTNQNNPSNHE